VAIDGWAEANPKNPLCRRREQMAAMPTVEESAGMEPHSSRLLSEGQLLMLDVCTLAGVVAAVGDRKSPHNWQLWRQTPDCAPPGVRGEGARH
jgi:hypothetical protein